MNTENNIVLSAFPKNVIDQANTAARLKTSSLLAKRLDLRGKTVFSFSDSNETVPEYAFSVYRKQSGWQLGVHVSDVAEYVCEGSPLDVEAAKRLITVNNGFVSSDMLPQKISKDLCGLSVGSDKLAVSVLLDIDEKGKTTSIVFEESVIRIAQNCVYKEIDDLAFSSDTSAVFPLREKYGAIFNPIGEMYELAALFCNLRRENGGLDCGVFKRVYNRDENGNIVSFSRIAEPDTRAMVREIGYYVSQAIGTYLYNKKLPCIFVGTETVPEETLDYLGKLIGFDDKTLSSNERTASIADKAKGLPYYGLVCDIISASLPCSVYSAKPIFSTFCGCDKIVSFINPANRYADLITQRMIKTCIAAKGDPKNLNINRYRKILSAAAENANRAAKFAFETSRKFANVASIEYLEHSSEKSFTGFPLLKDESGTVQVMLECGAFAVVPSEYSKNFDFEIAKPYSFEIVALGTDYELTVVKPFIE